MSISQMFLPEFDHEMANTRKTLERVPDDQLDWQPHAKSMTLGRLAGHLAELPGWTVSTLQTDGLDMNPPGGPGYKGMVGSSQAQILETFDKKVAEARAAIAAATDEDFAKTWSLLNGGQTIFSLPRPAVLRSFVMNHNVHHRAQLGVYLRLLGISVPSIYGPSADEGGM